MLCGNSEYKATLAISVGLRSTRNFNPRTLKGGLMKDDSFDLELKCKNCGTIYVNIPEHAGEMTQIHCSTCDRSLGAWGELQSAFQAEINQGNGLFELKNGRIRKN